jgi:hypothetical protein
VYINFICFINISILLNLAIVPINFFVLDMEESMHRLFFATNIGNITFGSWIEYFLLTQIFWWWLHSKLSLFKIASKKMTVFQSGLKKFFLDGDESHFNQPPMLVTPAWMRHFIVHYQDSGCQLNGGHSFVGSLVQVSVTMLISQQYSCNGSKWFHLDIMIIGQFRP